MSTELTHLYRYYDYCGGPDGGTYIMCEQIPVTRRTAKGVFLAGFWGKGRREKFVLLSGRKRYAFPTDAEALASFAERKRAQLRHLNRQLHQAASALETAEFCMEADANGTKRPAACRTFYQPWED